MKKRIAFSVWVFLVTIATAGWFPGRAELQKLASDGSLHRIEVASPSGPGTATALRHVWSLADGSVRYGYVAATDDSAVDRDPAIEIDPVSGTPVVVWSRDEGSGFDLFFSRLENGVWRAPQVLVPGPGNDTQPQLRISSRFAHLVWMQESAMSTLPLRVTFERSSLTPVFGPERLPVESTRAIPPEGETLTGTPDPPPSDFFFTIGSPARQPGENPRVIVWGVRDAPVPIDYQQVLLGPEDATSLDRTDAGWIGGRFCVWYGPADRLYYVMRRNGRWTGTRRIPLSAATTSASAILLLQELIARETATP